MKGVALPTVASTALSFAMICSVLLLIGGAKLIRRRDRRKGTLMIAAAAVLLANVLIWTI